MRGVLRLAAVGAALVAPAPALAARSGVLAGRIAGLPAHAHGTTVSVIDPQSGRVRVEAAVTGSRFRVAVPAGIVLLGVTTHGRLRTFVGHSRILRLRAGRRVVLRPLRLAPLKRLGGIVLPPHPVARATGAARPRFVVYVRGVTQAAVGTSVTPVDASALVESDLFGLADGVGCSVGPMVVVADPKGPWAAAARAEIARSRTPAFDPRTRLRMRWLTPTHRVSGSILEAGGGTGVVNATIAHPRGGLLFSREVGTRAVASASRILARLAFYRLCPRRPPVEFDVTVHGTKDLSSDVGGAASLTWTTTLFMDRFGAPTHASPASETESQRYVVTAGESTWTASGTVGACTLKGSGSEPFAAAGTTPDSMLWYDLTLGDDAVRHYRALVATPTPLEATLTCPMTGSTTIPIVPAGSRMLWWDTATDPGLIDEFPPRNDLVLIGRAATPAPVETWSWVAVGSDAAPAP